MPVVGENVGRRGTRGTDGSQPCARPQDSRSEGRGRDQHRPGVREAWERLALARTVATEVVRYRADHGLSQRDLARALGVRQPQVARLENAEHNPSHETLVMLASRLGIEFNISLVPADRTPVLLTREGREGATVCIRADDAVVRFTAR